MTFYILPQFIQIIDTGLFILNDVTLFFRLHLDLLENNVYTPYTTFESASFQIDNSQYFFTNPIDNDRFRFEYITFKLQHLEGIDTSIIIPQYLNDNNELRYFMNVNTWDSFNVHNQLLQILGTKMEFDMWYLSNEIQTAESIYRYELHDLVWDNRDRNAFAKYGIRHFELEYLLENSHRNQIIYLKNALHEDTLLISPCVIGYFRFRP
jgi:hypothetical protein